MGIWTLVFTLAYTFLTCWAIYSLNLKFLMLGLSKPTFFWDCWASCISSNEKKIFRECMFFCNFLHMSSLYDVKLMCFTPRLTNPGVEGLRGRVVHWSPESCGSVVISLHSWFWTLFMSIQETFSKDKRKKTATTPLKDVSRASSMLQRHLTGGLYRKERANFTWWDYCL